MMRPVERRQSVPVEGVHGVQGGDGGRQLVLLAAFATLQRAWSRVFGWVSFASEASSCCKASKQSSIKSSLVSTKNHPNSDCKREFLSCLNFLLSMYKEFWSRLSIAPPAQESPDGSMYLSDLLGFPFRPRLLSRFLSCNPDLFCLSNNWSLSRLGFRKEI